MGLLETRAAYLKDCCSISRIYIALETGLGELLGLLWYGSSGGFFPVKNLRFLGSVGDNLRLAWRGAVL